MPSGFLEGMARAGAQAGGAFGQQNRLMELLYLQKTQQEREQAQRDYNEGIEAKRMEAIQEQRKNRTTLDYMEKLRFSDRYKAMASTDPRAADEWVMERTRAMAQANPGAMAMPEEMTLPEAAAVPEEEVPMQEPVDPYSLTGFWGSQLGPKWGPRWKRETYGLTPAGEEERTRAQELARALRMYGGPRIKQEFPGVGNYPQ